MVGGELLLLPGHSRPPFNRNSQDGLDAESASAGLDGCGYFNYNRRDIVWGWVEDQPRDCRGEQTRDDSLNTESSHA